MGQSQTGAGSPYQQGSASTSTTPYQPALESQRQHRPALPPPPSTTSTSAQTSRAGLPAPRDGGQLGPGLTRGRAYALTPAPRVSETATPAVDASYGSGTPRGTFLFVFVHFRILFRHPPLHRVDIDALDLFLYVDLLVGYRAYR